MIGDTCGAALARLARGNAAAAPDILRLDQAGAEEVAGEPLPDLLATVAFARRLIARGTADMIVIGRNAKGSLLVTADRAWFCVAPQVDVVSTIGAGDSSTGGFAWAMTGAAPLEDALCRGVAATTVQDLYAALSPQTLCFERDGGRGAFGAGQTAATRRITRPSARLS